MTLGAESCALEEKWRKTLCQYMNVRAAPQAKRQARRLLHYACGSKEKYRMVRDIYVLSQCLQVCLFVGAVKCDFFVEQNVQSICAESGFDPASSDPPNATPCHVPQCGGGGALFFDKSVCSNW